MMHCPCCFCYLFDLVQNCCVGLAPVYYFHVAPPDSVRGPHYISHPPHSVYPIPTPEALALRTSVVKQIEYYFR